MKNIIVVLIISPIVYRGLWHIVQIIKSKKALCGSCTRCGVNSKNSCSK